MNTSYKFKIWHLLLLPLILLIPFFLIFSSSKLSNTSKWLLSIGYAFILLIISIFGSSLQTIQISASKEVINLDEVSVLTIEFHPEDKADMSVFKCTSSNTNVIQIRENQLLPKDEGISKITCSQDDVVSNEISVQVILTKQQAFTKRLNALIENTGDIGYQHFTSIKVNYSIDIIEDISTVYEKYKIGNIILTGEVTENSDGSMTTQFFTSPTSFLNITTNGNELKRIEDHRGELIFNNGTVKENYILRSDIERKLSIIISDVKKEVKKGLLYPNTAEFININELDNSNWTFYWKEGYLSVISIVRSENIFGEKVPKSFLVQFRFLEDVFFPTYIEIGDTWSQGTFFDHTN